jgi:hypothetical protein
MKGRPLSVTSARAVPYHQPMDDLALGLQRLGAAETKQQLVDALWDLRDSAYDQPQAWGGLTVETLLQALAEELEEAPGDGGQTSIPVLARVLEKALDPRLSGQGFAAPS